MKNLELELHKKAETELISRKLITLAHDNDAKAYRSLVEVSNTNVSIQTYMYVPSEGLSEDQVCRIILALSVAYYLGMDVDGIRGQLITEAKEPNKDPGKKKASTRKKPATKTPEPKEEEEESKPEEVETEVVAEEKVEAKPKKKQQTKPKTIAYDRTQEEHRKELSKVLHANFPGWDKDKSIIPRAKAASENLVGVAIFDSKGEVLQGFVDSVIAMMSDEQEESVDL